MPKHFSLLLLLALCAAVALPWKARANGYDFYPAPLAWSPDSSMLLAACPFQFPLGEGAPTEATGELRLYWPGEGRSLVLESQYCSSPCWDSDSQRFAAVANGSLHYYLLNQPNSAGRPLFFGALSPRRDILDCVFIPGGGRDGQPILYYSAGERFYGCGIYAWSMDMSERIVASLGGGSALAPLPLADSRLIFLGQGGYDSAEAYERLMLQEADGRKLRQLCQPALGPPASPGEYHESYPLDFDAGNEILFQRGGWGDWSLYRLNTVNAGEELLLADAQQPSLSCDGRWLLYTRRDPAAKAQAEYDWELPSSVWLLDLQSGASRQLSTDGYYAEGPALSPDGRWAAWLESPIVDGFVQQGGYATYGEDELPALPAVVIRRLSDITKGN